MNQEEAAKQAYKEMLKNKEAAGDTRQQKKAPDNLARLVNKQLKRAEKYHSPAVKMAQAALEAIGLPMYKKEQGNRNNKRP